jgi:hypothetical protein
VLVSNLTAPERETVITLNDEDATVHIWTAQRTVITALRKREAFTEVGSGTHGSSPWAAFTIPVDQWSPATGVKRSRNLSDEQREALAERMRRNVGKAA